MEQDNMRQVGDCIYNALIGISLGLAVVAITIVVCLAVLLG